jgi:hypothetical protein
MRSRFSWDKITFHLFQAGNPVSDADGLRPPRRYGELQWNQELVREFMQEAFSDVSALSRPRFGIFEIRSAAFLTSSLNLLPRPGY